VLPATAKRQGLYPSAGALLAEALAATVSEDFNSHTFLVGPGHLLARPEHDAQLAHARVQALADPPAPRQPAADRAIPSPPSRDGRAAGGRPRDRHRFARTGAAALGSMLTVDPPIRSLRHWGRPTRSLHRSPTRQRAPRGALPTKPTSNASTARNRCAPPSASTGSMPRSRTPKLWAQVTTWRRQSFNRAAGVFGAAVAAQAQRWTSRRSTSRSGN